MKASLCVKIEIPQQMRAEKPLKSEALNETTTLGIHLLIINKLLDQKIQ
jgi:hypothetical protein